MITYALMQMRYWRRWLIGREGRDREAGQGPLQARQNTCTHLLDAAATIGATSEAHAPIAGHASAQLQPRGWHTRHPQQLTTEHACSLGGRASSGSTPGVEIWNEFKLVTTLLCHLACRAPQPQPPGPWIRMDGLTSGTGGQACMWGSQLTPRMSTAMRHASRLLRVKLVWPHSRSRVAAPHPSARASTSVAAMPTSARSCPASSLAIPRGRGRRSSC